MSYWEGLLSLCWQDAVGQIGIAEMMMRYAFLTIDHGVVEVGKTLRDPGWHVDGLQGAEVPVKTGIDLQYIWTDALPTEFAIGRFETRGLDLEKHNIFQRLGPQVEAPGWHGSLWSADAFQVVRMNTCHVHRSRMRTSVEASETEKPLHRKLFRLSFSRVPVTSIKMTINPNMAYDYSIHTTTGNIPQHLI